jgi:hypothetical protein
MTLRVFVPPSGIFERSLVAAEESEEARDEGWLSVYRDTGTLAVIDIEPFGVERTRAHYGAGGRALYG